MAELDTPQGEYNYEEFSSELLRIELTTVRSQMAELQMRERAIMLRLGTLAVNRELRRTNE
jgi:hypothetical protein